MAIYGRLAALRCQRLCLLATANHNYPSYMSKVNAHYERIDPRNGVRNPIAVVDPFRMHFDNAHYNRIDPRNGVSHSVSVVNPFIMRIYFAHVSGVSVR